MRKLIETWKSDSAFNPQLILDFSVLAIFFFKNPLTLRSLFCFVCLFCVIILFYFISFYLIIFCLFLRSQIIFSEIASGFLLVQLHSCSLQGDARHKVSNFPNYSISCSDRYLKTSINGWPWITNDFIELSASASNEIKSF